MARDSSAAFLQDAFATGKVGLMLMHREEWMARGVFARCLWTVAFTAILSCCQVYSEDPLLANCSTQSTHSRFNHTESVVPPGQTVLVTCIGEARFSDDLKTSRHVQCIDGKWNTTVDCTEDKDECLLGKHNCYNNTICINNYGSFKCTCPPGGVCWLPARSAVDRLEVTGPSLVLVEQEVDPSASSSSANSSHLTSILFTWVPISFIILSVTGSLLWILVLCIAARRSSPFQKLKRSESLYNNSESSNHSKGDYRSARSCASMRDFAYNRVSQSSLPNQIEPLDSEDDYAEVQFNSTKTNGPLMKLDTPGSAWDNQHLQGSVREGFRRFSNRFCLMMSPLSRSSRSANQLNNDMGQENAMGMKERARNSCTTVESVDTVLQKLKETSDMAEILKAQDNRVPLPIPRNQESVEDDGVEYAVVKEDMLRIPTADKKAGRKNTTGEDYCRPLKESSEPMACARSHKAANLSVGMFDLSIECSPMQHNSMRENEWYNLPFPRPKRRVLVAPLAEQRKNENDFCSAMDLQFHKNTAQPFSVQSLSSKGSTCTTENTVKASEPAVDEKQSVKGIPDHTVHIASKQSPNPYSRPSHSQNSSVQTASRRNSFPRPRRDSMVVSRPSRYVTMNSTAHESSSKQTSDPVNSRCPSSSSSGDILQLKMEDNMHQGCTPGRSDGFVSNDTPQEGQQGKAEEEFQTVEQNVADQEEQIVNQPQSEARTQRLVTTIQQAATTDESVWPEPPPDLGEDNAYNGLPTTNQADCVKHPEVNDPEQPVPPLSPDESTAYNVIQRGDNYHQVDLPVSEPVKDPQVNGTEQPVFPLRPDKSPEYTVIQQSSNYHQVNPPVSEPVKDPQVNDAEQPVPPLSPDESPEYTIIQRSSNYCQVDPYVSEPGKDGDTSMVRRDLPARLPDSSPLTGSLQARSRYAVPRTRPLIDVQHISSIQGGAQGMKVNQPFGEVVKDTDPSMVDKDIPAPLPYQLSTALVAESFPQATPDTDATAKHKRAPAPVRISSCKGSAQEIDDDWLEEIGPFRQRASGTSHLGRLSLAHHEHRTYKKLMKKIEPKRAVGEAVISQLPSLGYGSDDGSISESMLMPTSKIDDIFKPRPNTRPTPDTNISPSPVTSRADMFANVGVVGSLAGEAEKSDVWLGSSLSSGVSNESKAQSPIAMGTFQSSSQTEWEATTDDTA